MAQDTPFRPALDQAVIQALHHLNHLDRSAVASTVELSDLRQRLERPSR